MFRVLRNSLLLGPAVIAAVAMVSGNVATAQTDPTRQSLEQIDIYSSGYSVGRPIAPVGQVTSVSQFSDVQPTDWAFQALQSLVERYGCIAGYPNGTYRGNRALTRYEFAAGLNACMDRVNELIAAGTADLVRKEDLATLKKLQDEFAAELKTLRGRVDALEARTATLEAQQFSTTTKLRGEAIFSLQDAFGDASAPVGYSGVAANSTSDNYNTTFAYRTRLNFDTSFTGKDRLRTRLQAGNFNDAAVASTAAASTAPGFEGRLGYSAGGAGAVTVDYLEYRFPIGDNARFSVAANAVNFNDVADMVTPFESSGAGALSRFGRYNPIFRTGDDKGVAASIKLSDAFRLELAYLAANANTPTGTNGGLFSGNYSGMANLVITPFSSKTSELKFGLSYINGYKASGGGLGHGTGSILSNLFGTGTTSIGSGTFGADPGVNPTTASSQVSYNSYGFQANWRLTPGFELGGWVGYTTGRYINAGPLAPADGEVWNYAVTLAFPDLGKKGNLAGLVLGIEPKLTGLRSGNGNPLPGDRDTGYHIEGFYRYALTDNIAITPGIIWLTAPNHDARNGNVVVGVIRTTFTF